MNNIKTDFLIVGSGLYGCVLAERIANILKKKVIILEKRNHIGGNCYSEIDKSTSIEYHKYGTHIFHTSIPSVIDYIQNFTKFNSYRHQVLSRYKSKIYQMPINLETINSFYKKNFTPSQAELFIKNKSKKYLKSSYRNFEEKAKAQIGNELYEAFIKNYTQKQWNKSPKELPASIFNRLPMRFNYDEDYYKNPILQGIPLEGYTKIFQNLIADRKIDIIYNHDFKLTNNYNVKYLTIYTGPIDKLFNNKYGSLEWRSLKFKKKIFKLNDFQGTSVINYPETKYAYTRIHEPKHLHPERTYKNNTLIIEEYPSDNTSEPYYPINTEKNKNIFRQYLKLLNTNKTNRILTGGRLADYAYYDMDMTISAALKKFDLIKKSYK